MALKIVDRGGVCSTLSFTNCCIEDSAYIRDYFGGVKEYIIRHLKEQINGAPNSQEVCWTYSPSNNYKAVRSALDGFAVSAFALFYTTILASQEFEKARNALKEIGFTIDESKKIYNSKNCTYIYPVYGAVKDILTELEKYDDSGKPVNLDKVQAEKKEKEKKIPEKKKSRLAMLRDAA